MFESSHSSSGDIMPSPQTDGPELEDAAIPAAPPSPPADALEALDAAIDAATAEDAVELVPAPPPPAPPTPAEVAPASKFRSPTPDNALHAAPAHTAMIVAAAA